jgi:hypothetical protein
MSQHIDSMPDRSEDYQKTRIQELLPKSRRTPHEATRIASATVREQGRTQKQMVYDTEAPAPNQIDSCTSQFLGSPFGRIYVQDPIYGDHCRAIRPHEIKRLLGFHNAEPETDDPVETFRRCQWTTPRHSFQWITQSLYLKEQQDEKGLPAPPWNEHHIDPM